MRRLIVNDCLTCIPGTRTFWHDLVEWTGGEFVGGDYTTLADTASDASDPDEYDGEMTSLIVRNATWFPPIRVSKHVPTISLLQDIIPEGPMREMQEAVIKSSSAVVFNSAFTQSKYPTGMVKGVKTIDAPPDVRYRTIPLPVDFSLFQPGNPMGLQQALSLPDGCVLWVGACQGAAGQVKGWDIFQRIVRTNPDISFVAVVKDAPPDVVPPNLRVYSRLPHAELVKVMQACRVGLCTSRTESQHLAGIEMGACGLPMVAPSVGIYWHGNISGVEVLEPTVENYTAAIRAMLTSRPYPQHAREFWQKQCDRPVIKAQWMALIEEVEAK